MTTTASTPPTSLARPSTCFNHFSAPSGEIYNYSGLFEDKKNNLHEKLTLENTMWTTTVLTNGTVLGLVVYVGL